jgi:hypothetical protein
MDLCFQLWYWFYGRLAVFAVGLKVAGRSCCYRQAHVVAVRYIKLLLTIATSKDRHHDARGTGGITF